MNIGPGRPTRHLVAGLVVSSATLLAVVPGAEAGFTDLGSGWIAEWDASLDGFVDINLITSNSNTLFIQKSAEFTQGSVNGIFPSIPIVFRQTGPSSIAHIVIDDEIILNNTGEDWFGFEMDLLDDGDAVFNPAMTAASGGGGPIGFTIAPFTTATFSGDLTNLSIGNGTVTDGSLWFPGDGGTDGQLWIDVTSAASGPFTSFVLKETPVPGPGALAVMAAAGLLGGRRRRR